MTRLRSLRWRLTFLYLGLLSILLILLGFGQYLAARELLFRSNADVLVNDYRAVEAAFKKQRAATPNPQLPKTATPPPPNLRTLLLSEQFAQQLSSRRISAAIIDSNGGYMFGVQAGLPPNDIPLLGLSDYLNAARHKPNSYYLAPGHLDTSKTYLVVLNPILSGSRVLGLAQLSLSTEDIDRTLYLDRLLAAGGSVLVLILGLLLSPLIVGRALRPLEQMSKTAHALAAGDYKQRVTVPPTADEIGGLAVSFNQMAAGIEQAFEVRRQSEERMRQFVADASHELRTPLTAIAGYIDILGRRSAVDQEMLQSSLAVMQTESARMARLVNDLLTLTRFESGRAPSRRPVPLDAWLNETLDELHLEDKGARQSRMLEPGIVVTADPDALKQVVSNLALNAVKYAPGAEQRWTCFRKNGRAAIRIQDAGPGIAPEDLPHIFERFYRGQKSRDRSTGGSGLGLAIVKSIVEAHQGTVEAASEPGHGATFTAWLPLAA
jgi:two-component system OmpR family sensor kinase